MVVTNPNRETCNETMDFDTFVAVLDACFRPVWVGGQGARSKYAQNSHSNGQGTLDRDSGKDRAMEVGRGKEKGLHKDQYSIGDGNDKDHNRDSHKKDKDKVKKQHNDKKAKD